MISKYIDFKEEKNIDYTKLKEPAKAIKQGNLVLFPTETVYGIGANALDENACKKIFIAKGREQDNPLIAHISNIDMLKDIVESIGEIEQKLIRIFWPGPLTIVFNKREIVPSIVTAGLSTIAVRMPSSNIAKELIEYAGTPIAAPSANISGKPSGTLIEDIIDELDGKVEYIIDSGMANIGVESTVVRVIDGIIHILRPGKITKEQFEGLDLKVNIEKQVLGEYKNEEKVMSPGMKYKHYAPNTKCKLVYSNNEERLVKSINEIIEEDSNVLVLARTRHIDTYNTNNKIDIGDTLEEISKNIFTMLRRVDSYNVSVVVIEGVEQEGLGLAIMNRLIRACENNYVEV